MKDGLFSIGDVSKIKGVTVKALRFYDDIGLLKPHFIDPETGYRYYHADQMLPIDIIKAARSLEISPNRLIPFFEQKDAEGLIALLAEHHEKTEERLIRLRNVLSGTDQICENYLNAKEFAGRNDVYRRRIAPCHAICAPFFETKDPEKYLLIYADLERKVDERGLIATYESGMLFEIRENVTAPKSLFTTVAHSFSGDDYLLIPGGEYICVSFTESNAIARQKILNRFLKKNRLEPLLVLQTELLTELFREDTPVWELRVLVSAE